MEQAEVKVSRPLIGSGPLEGPSEVQTSVTATDAYAAGSGQPWCGPHQCHPKECADQHHEDVAGSAPKDEIEQAIADVHLALQARLKQEECGCWLREEQIEHHKCPRQKNA